MAYYLGSSYLQTGHTAEAISNLADFAHAHPDSLLVAMPPSAMRRRSCSKDKRRRRSLYWSRCARPYAPTANFNWTRLRCLGPKREGRRNFRNIYSTMPASADADAAYTELENARPRLPPSRNGGPALSYWYPGNVTQKQPTNIALWRTRPALTQGLLCNLPSPMLSTAAARIDDAKSSSALALFGTESGEINAQRLYLLGEIAWSANDNDAVLPHRCRVAPVGSHQSDGRKQALLSAANLHLVHHEYDQALDTFREFQQRFPTGARASYAHWKAAWLTLRQGRNEDAEKAFEGQISLYPNGAETSSALYGVLVLAEEDNQPLMARAFYQKLSDRYRNFYYAELGRQRMKHLPSAAPDATSTYPCFTASLPSTVPAG